MAVITDHDRPIAQGLPEPRSSRRRERPSVTELIVAAHGVALAVLVGVDGPAPWPAVRALIALHVTAGTLWVGRSRRRGGSYSFVLLGLVGMVAGGAIGVAHAVRVGVVAESIAGIAALASGIALITVGTRGLMRGGRWWRKAMAVPAGLVVAIGVLFPLTLATFVTNVPPLEAGDVTPADEGLAYEEVSLRTGDGIRLAAWYVPSTNGAAVVVLPGAGGVRSDEVDHAAVLARHGYGVLLVDVRGHGDSDGDAMLWGWHGNSDVRAAVDYLSSRAEVADGRIAALGMSMGAEQAIGAAGSDPRIRAVVAEGASGQGPADEGADITGVGGWLTRYVDWTTTHAADLMTSAHRPSKLHDAIAKASPRPVLVIAAGESPAEIDAGYLFHRVAPESVQLWIVPDTGHTKGYETHPVEWESRVIEFLESSLGGQG